ncbi:hypothetical protein EE612_053210 [Oryza sativa]|nr:hypothetical protein EE612_053210 [Oryza sativa]
MLPALSAVLRRAPTPFSLLPLPPRRRLRLLPFFAVVHCFCREPSPPLPRRRRSRRWRRLTSSGRTRSTRGRCSTPRPLSYAMVNLRPLLPGNVLVCPKREVKRFADLSSNEISDLWVTAKEVGIRLEQYHKASSLTFAIQDGPQAGQTVSTCPHPCHP